MSTKLQLVEPIKPFNCKVGRVWAWIEGYEGLYQVSNDGQVRATERTIKAFDGEGLRKAKVLTIYTYTKKNKAYPFVHLYKGGNSKQLFLAALVARTFIPNPERFRFVEHKDNNRMNCRVENLLWVKKAGFDNQSGAKNVSAKLTDYKVIQIRKLFQTGSSQQQLADKFKVSRQLVGQIINNKIWKHL